MPGVNYQSFACSVFAKGLGEHLAETIRVHSLYVYVADPTVGELLHHVFTLLDPSFVELTTLGAGRHYKHLFCLSGALFFHCDADAFSGLVGENGHPVSAHIRGNSFDAFNHVSGLDVGICQ